MDEQNILDLSDDDISFMSPEEAKTKIDQVMRDPKGPYFDNSNLKAHRVAGEKMTKLYQVVSPDELQTNKEGQVLVQQWPPHMVKIMGEALEEQEVKRQKFLDRAREDMDALVSEHDFTRAEVPDDLEIWQANLLHAERLNAGTPTPSSLAELSAILEKEAQAVPFDPVLREAIACLSAARLSLNKFGPKQFSEIAEIVIHLISNQHEKTQKKGKK